MAIIKVKLALPSDLDTYSKDILVEIPQGQFYVPGVLVKCTVNQNSFAHIVSAERILFYYASDKLGGGNFGLLANYIKNEQIKDNRYEIEAFVQSRIIWSYDELDCVIKPIDEQWNENDNIRTILYNIYLNLQNRKVSFSGNLSPSFIRQKPVPIVFWQLLYNSNFLKYIDRIKIVSEYNLMNGLYLFFSYFIEINDKLYSPYQQNKFLLKKYKDFLNKISKKSEFSSAIEFEVTKLEKLPVTSQEFGMGLNYLDVMIDLASENSYSNNKTFNDVESIFNANLFGADFVKDIVLDYLACYLTQKESHGISLCLIGPPGVGKTTVARLVAESLGYPLVTISLNGIKDDGILKGHSRSYVGALPGKIVQAIRKHHSSHLVVLLDEVDKINSSKDLNIDTILLELLDKELSTHFVDNYVSVPIDISKIIFMLTANNQKVLSNELQSRLEIVSFYGYSVSNKKSIFYQYLLPKVQKKLNLEHWSISVSEKALDDLIHNYTQEKGVRQIYIILERLLKRLLRLHITNYEELLSFQFNTIEDILKHIDINILDDSTEEYFFESGIMPTLLYDEQYYLHNIEMSILYDHDEKFILTGCNHHFWYDSVVHAKEITRKYLMQNYENTHWLSDYGFHVHVDNFFTKTTNTTLSLVLLFLSLYKKIEYPNFKILFLADVRLNRQLYSSCNVSEVLLSAEQHHFDTIILGKNQKERGEKMKKLMQSSISLYFFDTVDEVIDYLFQISESSNAK